MRQVGVRVRVPLEFVPRTWLIQALVQGAQVVSMPKSVTETIAARIEEAIRKAGYLSQDQFAHEIGLPRATLYRVLSGKIDPRVSTLAKISKGLNVPLEDFFKSDGAPSGLSKGHSTFHRAGPKKKSNILMNILIPVGEDVPGWLQEACRQGVAFLESGVDSQRKGTSTKSKAKHRKVGLSEILPAKKPPKVSG